MQEPRQPRGVSFLWDSLRFQLTVGVLVLQAIGILAIAMMAQDRLKSSFLAQLEAQQKSDLGFVTRWIEGEIVERIDADLKSDQEREIETQTAIKPPAPPRIAKEAA